MHSNVHDEIKCTTSLTCVAVLSLAALRTCHDIVHADCRWKRYLYRESGQEPVPEGRNWTLPNRLIRLVGETEDRPVPLIESDDGRTQTPSP